MRAPKYVVLISAAVLSFLIGAVNQYVYPGAESTPIDFAAVVVFAFLVFAWFRLDTRERGFPRSPGLSIAVVLLAGIALPYYFFKSRGAKGGFVAVGYFLLALIGSALLTMAGQYSTYFGLQS